MSQDVSVIIAALGFVIGGKRCFAACLCAIRKAAADGQRYLAEYNDNYYSQ